MKTLPNNEFIKRSNIKHDNKYDYSNVIYKGIHIKVKIICEEHGEFHQIPHNHLNGSKCPKCSFYKRSVDQRKKEEFIKNSEKIFNGIYDYSNIKYINNRSKLKLNCTEHGDFKISPQFHLKGNGCPVCRKNYTKKNNKLNFIEKSNKIHNNVYDYSNINYITNKIKIEIKCDKHGIFQQKPNDHISGRGCPTCSNSKGELAIRKYLTKNNINFFEQYTFNDCKSINLLSFDFYLPKYNMCIEYDGKQHFKSIEFFGGDETFEGIKMRDVIKNNFCEKNNMKLVRIPYYNYNKIKETLNGCIKR
jgi:hypothetical protein